MAFAHVQPPSVDGESSPAAVPKAESVYPPERQGDRGDFRGHVIADSEPSVSSNVVRLRRRSEFLSVAGTGRRWVAPAFVLQVGQRPIDVEPASAEIGLGFTATKRIGNAVARNRAKRRLRAAARQLLPGAAASGNNYVLIARTGVLTCVFQTLLDDLEKAFSRVITAKPRPTGRSQPASRSRSSNRQDAARRPAPTKNPSPHGA